MAQAVDFDRCRLRPHPLFVNRRFKTRIEPALQNQPVEPPEQQHHHRPPRCARSSSGLVPLDPGEATGCTQTPCPVAIAGIVGKPTRNSGRTAEGINLGPEDLVGRAWTSTSPVAPARSPGPRASTRDPSTTTWSWSGNTTATSGRCSRRSRPTYSKSPGPKQARPVTCVARPPTL